MPVIDKITEQVSSASLANVHSRDFFQERLIDFAEAGNEMAAADTMDLFAVPANVLIMGAKVEVITADSAATPMDLGITGGDVDLLLDGVVANATGISKSGDAVAAEAVVGDGGMISDADWIVSLLANTTGLSDGVMRFQIWGVDLSSSTADPA